MDRERKFVLPLPDEKRRLVAHIYKKADHAANVWFSVKDNKNEDPEDAQDHEDDLVVGFEAHPEDATVKSLVASTREGTEHQEEAITKAFFDTIRRQRDTREKLLKSYPEWTQDLLNYLQAQSEEVRTEYYFQLDTRLSS